MESVTLTDHVECTEFFVIFVIHLIKWKALKDRLERFGFICVLYFILFLSFAYLVLLRLHDVN